MVSTSQKLEVDRVVATGEPQSFAQANGRRQQAAVKMYHLDDLCGSFFNRWRGCCLCPDSCTGHKPLNHCAGPDFIKMPLTFNLCWESYRSHHKPEFPWRSACMWRLRPCTRLASPPSILNKCCCQWVIDRTSTCQCSQKFHLDLQTPDSNLHRKEQLPIG